MNRFDENIDFNHFYVCFSAVYHAIVTSDPNNDKTLDLERYPANLGITLELCAGIVDKSKPLNEIASEEVLEECGYNVPVERMELVMTYRSGVGTNGSFQTLYYCEVTDDDKTNGGGGVGDEIIDVVEYTMQEARELVSQGSHVNSPPSCLLGVLWFLHNKV